MSTGVLACVLVCMRVRRARTVARLCGAISSFIPRECARARRFGPFFVEPIVAGLEGPDNKPYITSMDLIGAQCFAEDFCVAGTCGDNLVGMCESLYEPDLVQRAGRGAGGGEVERLTHARRVVGARGAVRGRLAVAAGGGGPGRDVGLGRGRARIVSAAALQLSSRCEFRRTRMPRVTRECRRRTAEGVQTSHIKIRQD